ncbi:MAG: sulfatase-like hydrolase/transferase [bacterium]
MSGVGRRWAPFARATATALTAAILVWAAGCSRPEAFSARNVLLVLWPPTGADAVGCGGDPAARTPTLDRLARQGAMFRDAWAASPDPRLAWATLADGQPPHRRTADATFPTLERSVAAAGLTTATFGLPPESASPTSDPVADATAWLARVPRGDAFFLATGLAGSSPERTDSELLRLVQGVEDWGHMRRTFILVTSPCGVPRAGESVPAESARSRFDESVLRVPLVLWGPYPWRGGSVRPDLAAAVDVVPTVLEAIRVGGDWRQPGRALAERVKPWKEPNLAALAEGVAVRAGPGDASSTAALRRGDWKLVAGPDPALFDLARDPAETTNLADTRPDVLAELEREIESRRDPHVLHRVGG